MNLENLCKHFIYNRIYNMLYDKNTYVNIIYIIYNRLYMCVCTYVCICIYMSSIFKGT